MANNNKWEIIHDCDDDNGNPTCWGKEINHSKHGRFVWIEENEDGRFDVRVDRGVLVTCKTLTSAKRWVASNIQ